MERTVKETRLQMDYNYISEIERNLITITLYRKKQENENWDRYSNIIKFTQKTSIVNEHRQYKNLGDMFMFRQK